MLLKWSVSVCESRRHITSAASSEGHRSSVLRGKGWVCSTEGPHSAKKSHHTKPLRQEEEEADTDTLHLRKGNFTVTGRGQVRASVVSSLQVDTGIVTRVELRGQTGNIPGKILNIRRY